MNEVQSSDNEISLQFQLYKDKYLVIFDCF